MDKSEIKKFYDNFYYSDFDNIAPWHWMILEYFKSNNIKNKLLLDIGCYRWYLFKWLIENEKWNKSNLFWIDISPESLEYASKNAEKVYEVNVESNKWFDVFNNEQFDIIVSTEIIEHINDFSNLLFQSNRILKSWGIFILSFPNYLNLFWYVRKKISEYLNKPEMMYLQPIEKEYTYFFIKKKLEQYFDIIEVKSSLYLPKFLLKYETSKVIWIFERFNLMFLSFSPMFICKKK